MRLNLQALKQDLYDKRQAAIALQFFALAIAGLYFYLPLVHNLLDGLAEFKQRTGLVYSMLATGCFGALLPFMWQYALGHYRQRSVVTLFTLLGIWALMGAIIDVFYQHQAIWFGTENTVATLAKKVAVDQFVFSTLVSCLIMSMAYRFVAVQCDWLVFKQQWSFAAVAEEIGRTILTTWVIWIPSVTIIYSLPSSLQIPFFNIVLCFFALVMSQRKVG